MNQPTLPPPQLPPPAAWYPDPSSPHTLRWWDGRRWTEHVTVPTPVVADPLAAPRWWSWPALICSFLVVFLIGAFAIRNPMSVIGGLVPICIVGPVLKWLDRVEPEPIQSRIHALLWGGGVAVVISLVVNTATGVLAGSTAAAVLSAPLIEEATKGLGLVWIARRKEIDCPTDGIVFAGWVALGFLIVEDMSYLDQFSGTPEFCQVFVMRVLFTPFAHPLMTLWIGLAIGRAVVSGRPLWTAWWGYVLAVLTHMGWNGSLALTDRIAQSSETGAGLFILTVAVFYLVLFVGVVIWQIRARRRSRNVFSSFLPFLANHYRLAPHEVQAFSSWASLRATRRSLSRAQRKPFDIAHASLAKLWMMHARPGGIDQRAEARQYQRLRAALDHVVVVGKGGRPPSAGSQSQGAPQYATPPGLDT